MPDILELLGNTADGAFATDAEGRIVYWNPAARKILGWRANEVLGRHCCDVLRGISPAGELLCFQGCHVDSLLGRSETVPAYDLETRDRSGRSRWLNLSTLAVPDSQRRLHMTIHFFRDITSSRSLESKIQALLGHAPASTRPPPADLTRREVEILRLMAHGIGTGAIAEKLGITALTVRNHVQHILNKLEVHSRLEAVAFAWEHGLLTPEPPRSEP